MIFLKNKKATWVILGFILLLDIFAWNTVYSLNANGTKTLEVTFFDVGQGDAIFIETPNGHQILIDGGPNSKILEKLSKEMPFFDRSLDLIILTHPEKDHLTGLIDVLKNYQVDNIFWTGVARESAEWKEWDELIKKEGARIEIASYGDRILLEESESGMFFDVLYPSESLEGKKFEESNNTSVVLRLIFGETSFLFTGDIEKQAEKELVDRNIDSDVIKIAHHGSKTSSSEEFIEKVSPKIAIIEVGKNSYGHPSQEVLMILERFGIKTLTTEKQGDIKIISEGNKIYERN